MPETSHAGRAIYENRYQIKTNPLRADFFVEAVSDDSAFKILNLPAG